ncbi:30S ribosomal protein S6 [Candidatus Uhrbacteria bacterium CG_4_9_14_0_2_um_filter_41_50]|uniref:Small ribosomal subunit protein bS6 n=1 Tax=Candidatus Uhrbacteria bacterium CG_4_9_14_0_2_um_filter_41_50 TaxID=1975031 RepID=A0A2M8EN13_9BACT|nr:MAG: 30S ribosomal protein S6 [Candidatus Uhrbacteria bacterium CG_4_10_14_3_um_filter_41_21]PIZ55151.1 MAG: 30S ribosomal protein S6 [Candidatus Uhrbacteria bacterium CG_4_10_14_0_2_um_filter_41_21]PJB84858.1 MAG: 30S ribosomal protein S6 [Candidatus Uhrbacteria bacterium CG_4_9_14_0_8_um_filter_41_16]PJC24118.1 MAG: 30S ribosomal protein S6 [Candidatus Uhrbacteria bacterium CG_4_9_14_0_2_um_filter_41_50]PJE75007.1 MAG: 30S ribosomal protein S6 [Candidatus Uhrbacteria bacterium CG10_big_fil
MIYEVLYIIPSKYSDTEIDGIIERVSKYFEANGAKVEQSQNLGKIKFAYTVNKVSHGTYVLNYISGEEIALQKLDQDLRLSEEVLRHVIVKRPHGIPTGHFKLTSYQEPLTPEGKRATAKKAPRREKAPVQQEEKSVSAEDLDKRLDQILETDLNNL